VAGVEKILSQNPYQPPTQRPKKSPKPLFTAEANLFPTGCYPPALAFTGSPAPRRPPAPPTRPLRLEEKKVIERGPIPVVALPVRIWLVEPRARGHPP
jgi:hypothetical protein